MKQSIEQKEKKKNERLNIRRRMKIYNKEVKIQVDDIEPFINNVYTGFKILWSGNIGWGEYTIYKINGENKWYADTEHMESSKGEHIFLDMLLKDFMTQIDIKE